MNVTRDEWREFREEVRDGFKESNDQLRILSELAHRHDERINNLRDTKGRWIAVIGTTLAALFSWFLHQVRT